MSKLREAQKKVKAELAAQISDLEADITACWEELQVRRGNCRFLGKLLGTMAICKQFVSNPYNSSDVTEPILVEMFVSKFEMLH
ncbi:hypothetical protein DPMN_135342 [Dreissena polymorpha]|uniref:Uncharacterized protein n=1 Tax=Dreissena polymorpha TaxID=45954 RepID=A0A9D4FEH0_DREPO|nr:hypothetical protein DPMN_081622 [Dreissena polymorpha]KAH3797529.1 hypothetical protein DPMN_151110 [Dreissena polymorpha]KAH3807010.1 hypothetical protein DPMN_135342 [Dreissena polymorpha]